MQVVDRNGYRKRSSVIGEDAASGRLQYLLFIDVVQRDPVLVDLDEDDADYRSKSCQKEDQVYVEESGKCTCPGHASVLLKIYSRGRSVRRQKLQTVLLEQLLYLASFP